MGILTEEQEESRHLQNVLVEQFQQMENDGCGSIHSSEEDDEEEDEEEEEQYVYDDEYILEKWFLGKPKFKNFIQRLIVDKFSYYKIGLMLRKPLAALDTYLEDYNGKKDEAGLWMCLRFIQDETLTPDHFFICLFYIACKCGLQATFRKAFDSCYGESKYVRINKYFDNFQRECIVSPLNYLSSN